MKVYINKCRLENGKLFLFNFRLHCENLRINMKKSEGTFESET